MPNQNVEIENGFKTEEMANIHNLVDKVSNFISSFKFFSKNLFFIS